MSGTTHCPGCNQDLREFSFQQLEELRACPKCGLTADEISIKMQEELAGMFSMKMNMSEPREQVLVEAQEENIAYQQNTPTPSALGYNSSQHYYAPPAHLAYKNIAEGSRDDDAEIKQILWESNIDWSQLLSSQVNLFRQADSDQRNRLIELWRISPPAMARTDGLGGEKETTVEREEEFARVRYERNAMHTDTRSVATDIIIAQDADMNPAIGDDLDHPYAVEPYMKSGYEYLAERDYNVTATPHRETRGKRALDPAFTAREWWRDFVGSQSMENQYGAFEHMAQFHPSELQVAQEDEEIL